MSFAASQAPPRHVSPVQLAGFHHRAPYIHSSVARAPKFSATAAAATTSTTNISTKDHLSNLERFLLKQIPQRLSQQPNNKTTSNDPPLVDHEAQANAGGVGSGGGLFQALNLQRLIANPTEEMSPKSLARLHRLLSDTPRPSPRNSLASRWKYYHGAADWEGLLDPFDENLRRELVRYGDLVGAAYHAFQSLPGAQPGRPRQIVLPDRSYRVTSSLYATSSIDLPNLGPLAAPPWMSQRSSWVGYVAVCDSDREIKRMGRRDIVISLRGTATLLEWAENFRAGLVPMSTSQKKPTINDPKVECGFWSLFKTSAPRVPSLAQSVVAEVKRLMEKYKGEELSISITGHSLGAALGVLVADELAEALGDKEDRPSIAVFSFGGPKVGNVAFAKRVEARGVKVLRVVNANDVITKVPANGPAVMGGRSNDVYAHVGQELRLDSKSSPFLKPDAGPACCHDLEAYLHLVDGFLGSGCPFRANAKRSIARLMDQQRTSVKRLYVSKAHSFAVRQMVDPIAAAAAAALPSPST